MAPTSTWTGSRATGARINHLECGRSTPLSFFRARSLSVTLHLLAVGPPLLKRKKAASSRRTPKAGPVGVPARTVEYRKPTREDRSIRRLVLPAVLLLALGACSRPPAPAPAPPEPVGLPNLRELGDDLWSGATPEGDDGFRSLHDLGIKTIISVDGTRPDVERARRFGLRYVHIPVGYGGIPREQAVRLVRAAAELPGPIYVHCHHGQHRGPAAAALMRRCRGDGWTADEAVAFLHAAGTDPKYEGLYASVHDFAPPSGQEMQAVQADYPEVADVGGLAARMVEIDDLWDSLQRAKANGWPSPGTSESPTHLALRLNEQYREAARLPETSGRPESFRRVLVEAEHSAADLESALRSGDAMAAAMAFDQSAAHCSACHRDHRDRKRP
jgi:protein tyrosine phosphatase (PTP) superfamily phosphohydrolase (DUF442 family)